MDKFLSFIGILRKSGNLFMGSERVKEEMDKGNLGLVIKTHDFKGKIIENISNKPKMRNVKIIEINYCMDDINAAIGKYCGVIGVRDRKCADKLIELIRAENGEELNL